MSHLSDWVKDKASFHNEATDMEVGANLRAGIPFIHIYLCYTCGSVVVRFPLNFYVVEHTPSHENIQINETACETSS